MGYGYYILRDGREAGYAVNENCDHPKCVREINRGLDNLCGEWPDVAQASPVQAYGCKNYYCTEHIYEHECDNPACDVYPAIHYDLGGPCIRLKDHTGTHVTEDNDKFTETEKEEFERYDKEFA